MSVEHPPAPQRGGKLLYKTREAKAALSCGQERLYQLINSGALEARREGHRTYITAESLESFVASLPRVVTPTMAKAERAERLARLKNIRESRAAKDASEPNDLK